MLGLHRLTDAVKHLGEDVIGKRISEEVVGRTVRVSLDNEELNGVITSLKLNDDGGADVVVTLISNEGEDLVLTCKVGS